MSTEPDDLMPPPEPVTTFLVGLTSSGWRAFTVEGDRIPGCVSNSFDETCEMVRRRHPAALLYGICVPAERLGRQ